MGCKCTTVSAVVGTEAEGEDVHLVGVFQFHEGDLCRRRRYHFSDLCTGESEQLGERKKRGEQSTHDRWHPVYPVVNQSPFNPPIIPARLLLVPMLLCLPSSFSVTLSRSGSAKEECFR